MQSLFGQCSNNCVLTRNGASLTKEHNPSIQGFKVNFHEKWKELKANYWKPLFRPSKIACSQGYATILTSTDGKNAFSPPTAALFISYRKHPLNHIGSLLYHYWRQLYAIYIHNSLSMFDVRWHPYSNFLIIYCISHSLNLISDYLLRPILTSYFCFFACFL